VQLRAARAHSEGQSDADGRSNHDADAVSKRDPGTSAVADTHPNDRAERIARADARPDRIARADARADARTEPVARPDARTEPVARPDSNTDPRPYTSDHRSEAMRNASMQFVARLLVFLFAFQASGLTVAQASITITSLHHDRILGTLASTSVMRAKVLSHGGRLAESATLIGLTGDEYVAWHTQILNSQSLAYGPIPRHLDAMTGWSARRGGVYVLRDVDIPPAYGWEVDLSEPGRTLAIYLPADCGNLSLLKKPARVEAMSTRPPLPPPFHPPPPPAPIAATPPTPAPILPPAPVAIAPPPAVHHGSILPYIGLALIGAGIGLAVSHCTCPSPPPGFEYIHGSCAKRSISAP